MTGFILLMSVLLLWTHSAGPHQFRSEIEEDERQRLHCSTYEGRGVTPPRTSVYAADQGSDLVNFDSFVECRRHFLPERSGSRDMPAFFANLDELAILIAKRLKEEDAKVWHLQPIFPSKAMGEKVFGAVAFRLKSAGLKVSNLVMDEPELCPERPENAGLLALVFDGEEQKLKIGLCEGEQIQWWFHETK